MKKSIPIPTHIILLQSLVLLTGTVTGIAHAEQPSPIDAHANDVFEPPFDEPQIPSAPPASSPVANAELPAPQEAPPAPLPVNAPNTPNMPNAWTRARSKVPNAVLWGWVPTTLLGGYFYLAAVGQKDAAIAMTTAAVSQHLIGLHENAETLLEDAKAANVRRAVFAGLSKGLLIGSAIWAGAHGTTLMLDQVWISRDAAGIQGRFIW